MFIRNGINSILRERSRTALFSLLIFFLTLVTVLSLSVFLYCSFIISHCNRNYHSIAVIEYMGSEYPNEDEADPAARLAAKELRDETVLSVPGVTGWARGNTLAGSVEGFSLHSTTTPYADKGVIIVSRFSSPVYQYSYRTRRSFVYYTCTLNKSLYSRSRKENIIIDVLTGDTDFVPRQNTSYVLNGSFVNVSATAEQIGDYPMNGLTIFRVESFSEINGLPYAEYAGNDQIPERFLEAANLYSTMNNYVRVVPCHDVNDAYAFQQNELQLASGQMPDPDVPYSCVVTADMAEDLNLEPGSVFTLNGLDMKEDDRYGLSPNGKSRTYTVSGIATDSFDYYGTVWSIEENADTPLFGYLIGIASLRNDRAEEAAEKLQSLVPEQVRVTMLDQGYANTIKSFETVRSTSFNVLLVCIAGVTTVLLMFAFLFVGRQAETVKIMVSLGTPRMKIIQWFLSGALVICGLAALLGSIPGIFISPVLLGYVADFTSAARQRDGFIWYSETSLGSVRQLDYEPNVSFWPYLIAILGVIVIAMLFCLLFLNLASKSGTRKQGRSRVRVPRGKTSTFGRRGLRFAMLSIVRGGLRTLVVPLVSMVLTAVIIVLGGMYQSWQDELDDALKNTHIDGMVVSLNGRYYSNLAMSVDALESLRNVEGIEDIEVSYGYHYWLPGEMPEFGSGSFGQEHRQDWIENQPELVAVSSLKAAREFYYSDPAVVWTEGYDEKTFTQTETTSLLLRGRSDRESVPAVFSTSFMEEHGLSFGDTLTCMNEIERPVVLEAVGSYIQQGGKAQIYVPLSFHVPEGIVNGDLSADDLRQQFGSLYSSLSFHTCRFLLDEASDLENIRKRIFDQGFSAVGHVSAIRTTLLLRDASFLKLTESMQRNILIGKVMSAVISVLIILLGFIVSWLMTYSRRKEFALMRGFGAGKLRVFNSFFLEQMILCLIGCLIGSAALYWFYAGGYIQLAAVGAFLVCYLLGTIVSIKIIGKTDLMELLTVRE